MTKDKKTVSMVTEIRKIFIIIIIIIIIVINIIAVTITKQLKDMKPKCPYRCVLQIADTPAGRVQVCVFVYMCVSIPK